VRLNPTANRSSRQHHELLDRCPSEALVSFTAILWIAIACILVLLSLRRPAWAVSLYMLTFFAAPQLWWWGKGLPPIRYAYISGLVLLIAVVFRAGRSSASSIAAGKLASIAAILMVANATMVDQVITSIPEISFDTYLELVKFVVLYFLLMAAITDRKDLTIVVVSLAVGAAYIGYEITFNDRGSFTAGRLEDVGAPGADTANGLASMLLLILPVIGSLWVTGTWRHKALVLVAAPLALNVVVLCNSRGAFLGLIGGGLVFLLLARGPSRKRAIRVLLLGAASLYLLLGDPKILERFTTTFVGAEERDRSAASRIEFWTAGLHLLSDQPLGAGGGAFKFVYAQRYLEEIGSTQGRRGLHNGYLTEATDWGVQGLLIKLLFLSATMGSAYRTVKRCRAEGRADDALVGVSYISAMCGFLIVCMFGSFLASEWVYWVSALLVRYSHIYARPAPIESPEASPALALAASIGSATQIAPGGPARLRTMSRNSGSTARITC
jgi:putative inorganic carbon (hco3(-)) transporter